MADADNASFVLGTAQLGMAYGIANRKAKPDQALAEAIVSEAWQGGIRQFDTAQAYGDSEIVLGRALRALGVASTALVITKLMPPPATTGTSQNMRQAVETSLKRLGIDRLHGCLLHREEMLDQFSELAPTLLDCVAEGIVGHVGVSVYSPHRAVQSLGMPGITMLQLSANAVDRRFAQAGVFKKADEHGCRIYVRSIFLQGLLLLTPEELPDSMHFAANTLRAFRDLAAAAGMSPRQMALAYVRSALPNAGIVFGAETPEQVRENLSGTNSTLDAKLKQRIDASFSRVDERVLNPALWPRLTPAAN